MLQKHSKSDRTTVEPLCICGKPLLVNEQWCEDCWAEQASMWMWRGIGSEKSNESSEMTDIMDSRVLGLSVAAYRSRQRRLEDDS